MTKPKTKLIRMQASALRIHPLAQRDVLPSREKKLVAELDLDAIGVFHAVQYTINGVEAIWLVDGQHRLKALLAHGLAEWAVDVKVHMDATDDARASALFLKLNDRSPVTPYDKFRNEVTAGSQVACGALREVEARSLGVAKQQGDGKVQCVMAIKRVWEFDGGKTLGRTLDTIIAAWGRSASGFEALIVDGVGLLLKTYGEVIDHPSLVKKLAKYPGGATCLIGDARGLHRMRCGGAVARSVAEVVLNVYNAGRRSGKLDPL